MTTGWTQRERDETNVNKHPGQEVDCVVCVIHIYCFTCDWIFGTSIPARFLVVKLAHIQPHGQTSRSATDRIHHWNILRIFITFLSYITSFLQHQNRSITMITINLMSCKYTIFIAFSNRIFLFTLCCHHPSSPKKVKYRWVKIVFT